MCYHYGYIDIIKVVSTIATNNFGKTLKNARLAAGLTQEALAQKCGMKKQNISRYENSEREPNIRTAKAIADALGIELETLMNGENKNPAANKGDGELSEKDLRLLAWFRSLPPEKQQAILIAQDAPEDLA